MTTVIYVVQAITHGGVDAQVVFLTSAEACAFRDECSRFEGFRYTQAEADAADLPGYRAMREDFDRRHPWRRFSRAVRFVARSHPIGRPVKVQP